MKQYTTPEQTAKLIELGFEKPKGWCAEGISSHLHMYKHREDDEGFNYSIGEILSFLPKSIKVNDLFFTLCIHSSTHYWIVEYADISFGTQARLYEEEFIDALFAEIVILKEEGVI